MNRWILLLLLLPLGVANAWSDTLRESLGRTVRAQYAGRMPYATIVAHKNLYFAVAYNVDSETRNSTGKKTHFAVYEYVGKRWKYVFEFAAGVDADEESERLDALFARHRFSSQMRGQLMYGDELRI